MGEEVLTTRVGTRAARSSTFTNLFGAKGRTGRHCASFLRVRTFLSGVSAFPSHADWQPDLRIYSGLPSGELGQQIGNVDTQISNVDTQIGVLGHS